MSTIRRRQGRRLGTAVWTVAISLATALTLLLGTMAVFLIATSPNWLGR